MSKLVEALREIPKKQPNAWVAMVEAADELERLYKIEAAAKNLMAYQKEGAPHYEYWDKHFDALEEALK